MPIFLNKTQTLSSPHIVCVGLVLYLELFGYKFSLIMLYLIIIVIKISPTHIDPTKSTGVGLDFGDELDFFFF